MASAPLVPGLIWRPASVLVQNRPGPPAQTVSAQNPELPHDVRPRQPDILSQESQTTRRRKLPTHACAPRTHSPKCPTRTHRMQSSRCLSHTPIAHESHSLPHCMLPRYVLPHCVLPQPLAAQCCHRWEVFPLPDLPRRLLWLPPRQSASASHSRRPSE